MKWALFGLTIFINYLTASTELNLTLNEEFNMKNHAYKVLTLKEWEQAQASKKIITKLDEKDGFVHLSTASQLSATIELYFSKEDKIVLLQLEHSQIQNSLQYEAPAPPANRKGIFPHYYGELDIKAVAKVWNLDRGAFQIPIEVLLQAEQGSIENK